MNESVMGIRADGAGWFFLVALLALVAALAIHIVKEYNAKERKHLGRREKEKEPSESGQAPEDCSRSCGMIWHYESVIGDLKSELEYVKSENISLNMRVQLMQDTITNLRKNGK